MSYIVVIKMHKCYPGLSKTCALYGRDASSVEMVQIIVENPKMVRPVMKKVHKSIMNGNEFA